MTYVIEPIHCACKSVLTAICKIETQVGAFGPLITGSGDKTPIVLPVYDHTDFHLFALKGQSATSRGNLSPLDPTELIHATPSTQ